MSIYTKIKAWFKKEELSLIVAPLHKIRDKLEAFVERVEKDVEKNFKKIEDLHAENSIKSNQKVQAQVVKDNINVLLGDTAPLPTPAPVVTP